MRNIILINLLIILNLLATSCQKDDNDDNDCNNNEITHTSTMHISRILVKVELEGEDGNNQEIIKQIENKIKETMGTLGNTLKFLYENDEFIPSSGELIRIYDDKTEVKSMYRIETTDNNLRYLKIIDNNIEIDNYQLTSDGFLLKDFTEEYSSNYNIITALGLAQLTLYH